MKVGFVAVAAAAAAAVRAYEPVRVNRDGVTSPVQHVHPAVDPIRQYPPVFPVERHVPIEHVRLAGSHANVVGQHELGSLAAAPRERRDKDPGDVQQKRGLNLQTQPLQRDGPARPVHRGALRLLVREQRRGDAIDRRPGHRFRCGRRCRFFGGRRNVFGKIPAPNGPAARARVPEILNRERADRRVRRRRPGLAVERANLREQRPNGERRQGLAASAAPKQRQLHELHARGYPRSHPGRTARDESRQPRRKPTKRRDAATQAAPLIERHFVLRFFVMLFFVRFFGVLLERQQLCTGVDAKAALSGGVRRRPPRMSSVHRVRHSSPCVREGAFIHRIRRFRNLRRSVSS